MLPKCGSEGATGYDFSVACNCVMPSQAKGIVQIGLNLNLSPSAYARIAPHSRLAMKKVIDVGAGVVDDDYQGEVGIVLFNHSPEDFIVKVCDCIA